MRHGIVSSVWINGILLATSDEIGCIQGGMAVACWLHLNSVGLIIWSLDCI